MKIVRAFNGRTRDRIELVRANSDSGFEALQMLIIAAIGVTIIGLAYVAINTKALEKIGIINGG